MPDSNQRPQCWALRIDIYIFARCVDERTPDNLISIEYPSRLGNYHDYESDIMSSVPQRLGYVCIDIYGIGHRYWNHFVKVYVVGFKLILPQLVFRGTVLRIMFDIHHSNKIRVCLVSMHKVLACPGEHFVIKKIDPQFYYNVEHFCNLDLITNV